MEKEINYRVIYGDTDCGKVMYYANYFRIFEIGRTELIRASGTNYKEIEEKYGIILPVVETFVRYRASAYYDDILTIKTKIKELKPFKIVFEYKVYKERTLVAEGYTLHVPVNTKGKVVRIPTELLNLLKTLIS